MKDAEKLIAWVREAADELEKAHLFLDYLKVPRSVPTSEAECTLAARIALLSDRSKPTTTTTTPSAAASEGRG